eukprot:UN17179
MPKHTRSFWYRWDFIRSLGFRSRISSKIVSNIEHNFVSIFLLFDDLHHGFLVNAQTIVEIP